MQIYCTRPGCVKPHNQFPELSDPATLKSSAQRFCVTCGMPLFLQDRYVTSKLLGEGGFGAAYLAIDRYTPKQRPCVVKQFKPAFALNPKQLEMAQSLFFREAEVLDTLGNEHPQIPDLFASFDLDVVNRATGGHDRFFYLVQEYIDGLTLEQELHDKGTFSELAIVSLLTAMLPILAFIHRHNAIHRDIKPSNIMRNREGLLYLLDFGAMRDITKGSPNTSTGIYSQGYAPPEQVAGQGVTYSSDLYALAVTCVVLLTGKEPQKLFDSARNSWNWRSDAQVSGGLADILDRMLKAQPSSRFTDTKEVAAALVGLLPQKGAAGKPVIPLAGNLTMPPPPMPIAPPTAPPSLQTPLQTPPPMPAVQKATPGPVVETPKPPKTLSFRFTLGETITNAAFAGFEGALLAVGLGEMQLAPAMTAGLWFAIALAIVGLMSWRVIEGIDLLIFAALSLGLAVFLFKGVLLTGMPLLLGAAGVVVFAALLFRLVYNGLSRLG
jgi:serine/threonine protein kinase